MTLTVVFLVLITHWFADFVLQTDKQAKGKSNNWRDLLAHTSTYSSVWLLVSCILFGLMSGGHTTNWYVLNSIMFTLITFISHTVTDYFTSRLNSRLWAKGDVHNFFVSVGFDQVLHYVQLFLTLMLLL